MAGFRTPLGISILPSDEADERIGLAAFATAVGGWAELVRRVTLEESGARPLVHWVVQDLRVGSTHVELAPMLVPTTREEQGEAERVQRAVPKIVVGGLERVERGEDPSEVFSPEAAEQVRIAIRPLLDEKIAWILVHDAEREVGLTREGAGRRQEPPARLWSIGSVEGELKAVSFAETRPFFSLYRSSGGRAVRCHFDEGRFLDQVLANLRQRVLVAGRLTRATDGQSLAVTDVQTIRRLGGGSLPQPVDLLGIDPGMTGELLSEEWVDRRRRG